MTNNLIARLQAKSDLIRAGLGIEGEDISVVPGGASPHIAARPHNLPQRLRKKRIGRTPLVGQPKLFGGSLEEYLEVIFFILVSFNSRFFIGEIVFYS